MRAFHVVVCTALLLHAALADVSHLNGKYLPPMMMLSHNGNSNSNRQYSPSTSTTTTTIEKQILKELPEQIEYVQPALYGNSMPATAPRVMMFHMPSSMAMPMSMSMPMPAQEMLPPLPPTDSQYMLSMDNFGQPATQQPQEHKLESMALATDLQLPSSQYLPPTPSNDNYMHSHMQQMQPMLLPMPTDIQHQTHMAPETPTSAPAPALVPEPQPQPQSELQPEPEPAHMLTRTGYKYKVGSSFPTSAMMPSARRRFRFRQ